MRGWGYYWGEGERGGGVSCDYCYCYGYEDGDRDGWGHRGVRGLGFGSMYYGTT